MTSRRLARTIAALAAAVVLVPLPGPPGSAAVGQDKADLAIAGNGGYVGRGVIDPAPDPEHLADRAIRPGRSSRFVVELRNTGAAADTFTMLGSGDADGFGALPRWRRG